MRPHEDIHRLDLHRRKRNWFKAWGAMVLMVMLAPMAGMAAMWVAVKVWRMVMGH